MQVSLKNYQMVFKLKSEKTKIARWVLISLLLSTNFSCISVSKTAGNFQFETECLGIELDGSQTLKAWGNGRNRRDAIEQAKKNAVNDVIFKGISAGNSQCDKKPLVTDPMAREKNAAYFNTFFADNGKYLDYVSLADERFFSKIMRDRKPARQSVTHGIVVRVLRSELKKKLMNDGIIK